MDANGCWRSFTSIGGLLLFLFKVVDGNGRARAQLAQLGRQFFLTNHLASSTLGLNRVTHTVVLRSATSDLSILFHFFQYIVCNYRKDHNEPSYS